MTKFNKITKKHIVEEIRIIAAELTTRGKAKPAGSRQEAVGGVFGYEVHVSRLFKSPGQTGPNWTPHYQLYVDGKANAGGPREAVVDALYKRLNSAA